MATPSLPQKRRHHYGDVLRNVGHMTEMVVATTLAVAISTLIIVVLWEALQ
jgi:hypothetical protein